MGLHEHRFLPEMGDCSYRCLLRRHELCIASNSNFTLRTHFPGFQAHRVASPHHSKDIPYSCHIQAGHVP